MAFLREFASSAFKDSLKELSVVFEIDFNKGLKKGLKKFGGAGGFASLKRLVAILLP